MKLYELRQVYEEIMDLEVDAETLEAMLFSLKDSIEEKTENICKVMAQMEGEEDMLDTEIKRLTAKKKALGTRRSNLKEYLSQTLKTLGMSNIKGKLFSVSFRKSSKVIIDNENALPKEFVNETWVKTPDKKYIKWCLQNDKPNLPGCHIEESQNIQIK